jgi:GAF domain-containing protein
VDWEYRFQKIISESNKTKREKIESVLDLGLDFLGLGIGLVSNVKNEVYKVIYAKSPADMIEPGSTFAIGETYCFHTLHANQSVGFHDAGNSRIATHPCYLNFKLGSYIGSPISQNGQVIGTVNFSAAAPRDPFTEEEFRFVKSIAKWLGDFLD